MQIYRFIEKVDFIVKYALAGYVITYIGNNKFLFTSPNNFNNKKIKK